MRADIAINPINRFPQMALKIIVTIQEIGIAQMKAIQRFAEAIIFAYTNIAVAVAQTVNIASSVIMILF